MDQIIGEQENERDIICRIGKECGITVLHERQDSNIVFLIRDEGDPDLPDDRELPRLEIMPRVAAVRRNPPDAAARRPLCMADIERVKVNQISAAAIREAYHKKGFEKRLLSGALAYQDQMQVPLCFVETFEGGPGGCLAQTDGAVPMAGFFERFGFRYIYDRPHYELNAEVISDDMLEQAAAGENVCLGSPNVTLQVVGQEDVLSLAHFVNSRLCRQYGFFIIRSAAYYEAVQEKLQGSGGNLFQIMEDGIRKGCFAYTNISDDHIREAVFDKESDREHYLVAREGEKPAVMARIVNLPGMLRHISGIGKVTIAIRIEDPVIAGNDGLFIWYIDEKGSRIERVEQPAARDEEDPSMRPEVTVTIGELTALLFDYMQLKQNAKFDSIYLAGPAWMNELY